MTNTQPKLHTCSFCGIGTVKGLRTNLLKNDITGLYYHADRIICAELQKPEVREAILGADVRGKDMVQEGPGGSRGHDLRSRFSMGLGRHRDGDRGR